MQSGVLFNRFTTLPAVRGHFPRPRINRLLEALLERHLIVITAGAGSGKTHAVSAFLQKAGVRVFWLQLSELDNNVPRFWEGFLYVMASQNKDTARQMEQLGFPDSLSKFDTFLHILARDIYSGEQVVFVFDDIHLLRENTILRFIQNLILAKLENFCAIINSRVTPCFNLTRLFSSGLAGLITAKEIYFTHDETEEYLKWQGVALSKREAERVQSFTEGWPLALYLVGLSIQRGGLIAKNPIDGAVPMIFDMIEKEMFAEYTPAIQSFLTRISLLDSFPEDLVKTLAADCLDEALKVLRENMFIYFNPYSGQYSLHHLFLKFMEGKQRFLTEEDIHKTYKTAAKWCVDNDMKIDAMAYYDKCGCHDEILHIMLHFGVAVFTKSIAEFYIGLMDRFSPEMMRQNPLLHVHHAGLLYNNAEVSAALEELTTARKELELLSPDPAADAALGEIWCMLGLISLGMADYAFEQQFQKALSYLPDGSAMLNHQGRSLNTRHAIMLSETTEGALAKMEEVMFTAIPLASKVMHGYGEGLDYLASAEAAYFTGDMKKATRNAYESMYRAKNRGVTDVVYGGYFLLMRIEAAAGHYDGVITHLEQMKSYAEEAEDKWNFSGMPDVADGWFHLLFGNSEKIAHWLVDEAMESSVLAPYSIGMERSIKARYMLKEGKYYELLAWIGQTEKILRQFSIWLILLDILICKAIACHKIQDEEGALSALTEAYEIAHGNHIITPFIEYGNGIRAVIYNVKNSKNNPIPEAWLDHIYTKAATYEKHLRTLRQHHAKGSGQAQSSATMGKVTKREKELLRYLCRGLTNAEIAEACYITVSAVKKALNSIYIKLGATNRADAVRTAIQMGLNG